MPSVMNRSFGRVEPPSVPRSVFDRSSGVKGAIDADKLYPIFIDEVIPGDTHKIRSTMFARMATPIYPIMDNLYLEEFWFYAPYRILWDNFPKFLGAQDDPTDSIDYTIPVIDTGTGGAVEDTIFDVMGIPDVDDVDISALPLRMYNQVWNAWFRSQDLQDSLDVDTGDGPDTSVYTLARRTKRLDYFTSALPSPQKGSTAVTLPLGTSADVVSAGGANDDLKYYNTTAGNYASMNVGAGTLLEGTDTDTGSTHKLYADLQNATAATINAIRLAVVTQQFLERDARGGTRDVEIYRSHFGVVVPDFRPNRPEFLGSNTTRINMHAVPQQSETGTTPQGTLASFATGVLQGGGFTKSFVEYGLLMCLVNVRADLTYQQGIERFWRKSTRYDLYWPEFANIGEQTILQSEIQAANDAAGTNDNVFGYQERYAEYKYKPSRIFGAFRSSHSATLDPWHLSEELSTPALDSTFIPSNTPMARVEAVSNQPDFILDCYFEHTSVRPMPLYGTPGIARF